MDTISFEQRRYLVRNFMELNPNSSSKDVVSHFHMQGMAKITVRDIILVLRTQFAQNVPVLVLRIRFLEG